MAASYDGFVRKANEIIVLTANDESGICALMSDKGEIAAKLAALRKRAGLSIQELADALDMPKTTYAHYESAKFKAALPVNLAASIAAVLAPKGVPENEIMALTGLSPRLLSTTVKGPQRSLDMTPQPEVRVVREPSRLTTGQEDLPVFGYVAGVGEEETFFLDQGHEMTRTVRPNVLRNARDAYAVDVFGDSMSPRFDPGNRLWVAPYRPTKPGDDVVIQFDDERAIVKRLVRKTEKFVIVQQFNPPKEMKIPREKIKRMDLVVGMLTVATD